MPWIFLLKYVRSLHSVLRHYFVGWYLVAISPEPGFVILPSDAHISRHHHLFLDFCICCINASHSNYGISGLLIQVTVLIFRHLTVPAVQPCDSRSTLARGYEFEKDLTKSSDTWKSNSKIWKQICKTEIKTRLMFSSLLLAHVINCSVTQLSYHELSINYIAYVIWVHFNIFDKCKASGRITAWDWGRFKNGELEATSFGGWGPRARE